MATKKSSSSRSSSKKSSGSSKKKSSNKKSSKSKSKTSRFPWELEVLLFAVLAFCVVLFIANFGKGGAVGGALSHFFFGLFGVMEYVFPVALFVFAVYVLAHNMRGKKSKYHYRGRAVVKSLAGVVCFVFLCALCHTLYHGVASGGYTMMDAFHSCADARVGGGMVGDALSSVMVRGIGLVATYVVLIIVMVLCVVLISERSLFRGVSRRIGDASDERRDRYEEEAEKPRPASSHRQREADASDEVPWDEDQPERRVRRSEKKVSGVTGDLDLKHTEPVASPESEEAAAAAPIVPDHPAASAASAASAVSAVSAASVTPTTSDTPIAPTEEPTFASVFSSGRSTSPIQAYSDTEHMEEMDMTQFDFQGLFEPEQGKSTYVEPTYPMSGEQETPIAPTRMENTTPVEEAATESTVTKPKRTKKATSSMEELTAEAAGVGAAVAIKTAGSGTHSSYIFPDIRLLQKGDARKTGDSKQHLKEMSDRLQETLRTFGVAARVTNVTCGPSVTQYEVQPEMGVKVSKILNLADDIKLNMMVSDIRIEAPIPGKAAIGIEVPNAENVTVALRDLIESPEFRKPTSGIWFCVGKDIAGNVIAADIDKMPHLLIAGATGSGKSVCINTILMSILFKYTPDEVKLIMIDPKVVELSVYNNIPHLLIPVVTDPKKAAGALHWAVAEMTERYNKFAEYGVRDIEGYNRKVDAVSDIPDDDKPQRMSSIVIIVDELADLMMVAAGDVEDAICRLAQLARAAGIHLIIATQRPSVNVITGLIKANMPSRIAFSVTSGVDSRTILDMNGAEKLLGKGDMLFYPQGYAKPLRVQCAFVSDSEVSKVVDDIIAKNGSGSYNPDIEDQMSHSETSLGAAGGYAAEDDDRDVYFADAARFLIEKEKGSIGMLQRNFKIGFNRAARIMDQLEEAGVVGPEEGTKPRQVLMSLEEFEAME